MDPFFIFQIAIMHFHLAYITGVTAQTNLPAPAPPPFRDILPPPVMQETESYLPEGLVLS